MYKIFESSVRTKLKHNAHTDKFGNRDTNGETNKTT